MRKLLAAVAMCLTASAAQAATTYSVFDHSDGSQTGGSLFADYGLRLDAVAGANNLLSFWSFEDVDDSPLNVRGNSLALLTVDFAANGGDGRATLFGRMRRNSDDSLWRILATFSSLTQLGGSGSSTSFGAETLSGTLTSVSNAADVFTLDGKADPKNGFDFTLTFAPGLNADWRVGPLGETSTGAGWVDPAQSSGPGFNSAFGGCCNDFLFTLEASNNPVTVPLPAAGWLLLAGLGVLALRRRFAKG